MECLFLLIGQALYLYSSKKSGSIWKASEGLHTWRRQDQIQEAGLSVAVNTATGFVRPIALHAMGKTPHLD